jgi:hypothetical protein
MHISTDLPPWRPIEDQPLGEEALQILIANQRELIEHSRLHISIAPDPHEQRYWYWNWHTLTRRQLRALTEQDMQGALRVLNGTANRNELTRLRIGVELQTCIVWKQRVQNLPGFGATHLLRWQVAGYWGNFWGNDGFSQWLRDLPEHSVDLRALIDLLQRAGYRLYDIVNAVLHAWWDKPSAVQLLPAACVWPFFAAHPEFIDEGLGLIAPANGAEQTPFQLNRILQALATFSTLPARWLPALRGIALGETVDEDDPCRAQAQKMLGKEQPDRG